MIALGIIWLLLYMISVYKVFHTNTKNSFWEGMFEFSSFVMLVAIIITAIVLICSLFIN